MNMFKDKNLGQLWITKWLRPKWFLLCQESHAKDFPECPVVKILCFRCGVYVFDTGFGELRSYMLWPKKKKQAMAGSLSVGAPTLAAYRTLQQNHGPPRRTHEQHSCHEPKNSWIMREHPPWDQQWENGVLRGRLVPRPFVHRA